MPIILNSLSNFWKYSAKPIVFSYILQANLAVDISNSNLNNGSLAQFSDIGTTGTWQIYEGTTSVANITNSAAYTGGELTKTQMIRFKPNITDYFWRYTFDTRTYSGTSINDVFGGNTATMVGSVSINTVAANQPLSFGDGYLNMVNNAAPINYVQLPATFRPDMTAGTSFSFWVYVASTTANGSYAFSFGQDPSGGTGVVRFGIKDTSLNLSAFDNTGTLISDVSAVPVLDAWVHYIWVLVPSGTWYLYTNGALTNTFTGMTYLTDQSYNNCYFGRTNFAATPSFTGRLDDFQLFKRALSADEAFLIYKASRHQINYPFELADLSGTTFVANNAITKIYDGTLMLGAQITDVSNTRLPGKAYLWLTQNPQTYFKFKPVNITTNGFSVSTWVRANIAVNPGGARVFDIRGPVSEISLTLMGPGTTIRFLMNGTGYSYTGLTNLMSSSNIWNHVAISVTYLTGSTATFAFYYNGVYINQNTGTYTYPSTGFRAAYNIGGYGDTTNAPTERLEGGIDDFRWFGYPLSATEVSQLYNDTFDIIPPFNKIASTTTSLPAYSIYPGQNLLFPSETGYTVKANEITLSPGANNTFCVWTSPKTATYALDVSFADFGSRTDGVGLQIFTVNSDDSFKQQLFSRTATTTALTNAGGSYLTIPRYLVSLNQNDKIYLRMDLVTTTTNDASVISAFIYEQTVVP